MAGNARDAETHILAEEKLAAAAVKALVAKLAVVGCDTIAHLEALDVLYGVLSISRLEVGPTELTLPTAAINPTVSWPGIRGNLAMNSPSWMCYRSSPPC